MELSEKAAYLKGLIEGLGIDDSTKEGKVLRAVSELLGDLAAAVVELDSDLSIAYSQIDELEEELGELEGDLYDDAEEDGDDDGDETDYGEQYELTCPKCGTRNLVDEETLMSEEVYCAHCGTPFTIEFEESGGDEAGPEEE